MGRYTNIPLRSEPDPGKNQINRRFVGTTRYPDIPRSFEDIYVFAQDGDRFDTLAFQYYGDPTLWWAISSANPQLAQDSYYLPEGEQIRIPTDVAGIRALMDGLNRE